MARPEKDLPCERILTIIAIPGYDLANVVEQGFKVARHRIAGPVQVSQHLVQVVAQPHELPVNHPIEVAPRHRFHRDLGGPD